MPKTYYGKNAQALDSNYIFRGLQLKGNTFYYPKYTASLERAIKMLGGHIDRRFGIDAVCFPRYNPTPELLFQLKKISAGEIYREKLYVTPKAILNYMWDNSEELGLEVDSVLNLYAGSGAFLEPVKANRIDAVERHPLYRHILRENGYVKLIDRDAYTFEKMKEYDLVLASLPRIHQTLKEDIRKIYKHLKLGATLLLIVDKVYLKNIPKKYNATIYPIECGYTHITENADRLDRLGFIKPKPTLIKINKNFL